MKEIPLNGGVPIIRHTAEIASLVPSYKVTSYLIHVTSSVYKALHDA